MKRIDYVVQSATAPNSKHVLWLTPEGELKACNGNGWNTVGGTNTGNKNDDVIGVLTPVFKYDDFKQYTIDDFVEFFHGADSFYEIVDHYEIIKNNTKDNIIKLIEEGKDIKLIFTLQSRSGFGDITIDFYNFKELTKYDNTFEEEDYKYWIKPSEPFLEQLNQMKEIFNESNIYFPDTVYYMKSLPTRDTTLLFVTDNGLEIITMPE